MTHERRQKVIQNIMQIADEIVQRRQHMEILYMQLVSEKEWTDRIFPQFEQIRQNLNDLVTYLLLKELNTTENN